MLRVVRFGGLLALLALGSPGLARADMGFPGLKSRDLWVRFDNLAEHPDYVFYLAPLGWVERGAPPRWDSRPQPLVPDQPFKVGYNARVHIAWVLVAVPRERAEGATWAALAQDAPGVLQSNQIQLEEPGDVLFLDPRDYQMRRFRVALADGQLTLTSGAVWPGSYGVASWIPGLLCAVAVTALGLWVVRRRRRARAIAAEGATDDRSGVAGV